MPDGLTRSPVLPLTLKVPASGSKSRTAAPNSSPSACAGLRAGRDKLAQAGLTGVHEPLNVALVEIDLACRADALEMLYPAPGAIVGNLIGRKARLSAAFRMAHYPVRGVACAAYTLFVGAVLWHHAVARTP